ncbi:MAG: CopG family transcriptional regulator [Bdellovibrionota bacterium]
MKNTRKKKMTADQIAAAADRGEDVTKHFAGKGKMMPALQREGIQRMNVDFTVQMLEELDAEAKRLNISRQAVIKTMVSDAIDRRLLARDKKKAS